MLWGEEEAGASKQTFLLPVLSFPGYQKDKLRGEKCCGVPRDPTGAQSLQASGAGRFLGLLDEGLQWTAAERGGEKGE